MNIEQIRSGLESVAESLNTSLLDEYIEALKNITPPKVAVSGEIEAVVACLGDDAAYVRTMLGNETEIADNMEAAAELIESLSARLAQPVAAFACPEDEQLSRQMDAQMRCQPQGAQGEAVGEIERIDDDGVTVRWLQPVHKGTKLYTHPAEGAADLIAEHNEMRRYRDEWVDAQYANASAERAAVPDGWALVPVEPDAHMLDAASLAYSFSGEDEVDCVWKAMLSAAPTVAGKEKAG